MKTGPKTEVGKARSSENAIRHGVLSRKLLLPDESAADYQELLSALLGELSPIGVVEQLLVERIAVSIWRQRRMVGAETAAVAEQQAAASLATATRVRELAHLPFSDADWVKAMMSDPPDLPTLVLECEELEKLQANDAPLSALKGKYPRTWASLCAEAEVDEDATQAQQCQQAQAFIEVQHASLLDWVDEALAHGRKLLRVLRALATVREALALPRQSDLISRYQAALDNEWFKAMRALRDAQKFRLEQAALNAKALPEARQ